MEYTKPLAKLIECFQKLPSIGPKTAARLALHVIKMPQSEVSHFAQAILDAKAQVHYCENCFNMSAVSPCEICSDKTRNHEVICVVAETKDLMAIEKTNEYNGIYHVLQGLISPIDGIGPDDIRIKELLFRITQNNIKEIILKENHPWNGREIRDLDISRKTFIVMIKRGDTTLIPRGHLVLQQGDKVFLYSVGSAAIADLLEF